MEEQSRRDALKKGAVGAAGAAVLWAAPAITTMSRAGAVGTPAPADCECTASAFGLWIRSTILGIPLNVGPLSNVLTVGAPGDLLFVSVLPATTDEADAVCRANAAVALLEINAPGTLVLNSATLTSSASAPCSCVGGGGASNIQSLTVNGQVLVDVVGNVNAASPPNTVLLNALGLKVVVNEQLCDNNALVVRALHVTFTDPISGLVTLDVIVSESRAGNTECTCTAPPP